MKNIFEIKAGKTELTLDIAMFFPCTVKKMKILLPLIREGCTAEEIAELVKELYTMAAAAKCDLHPKAQREAQKLMKNIQLLRDAFPEITKNAVMTENKEEKAMKNTTTTKKQPDFVGKTMTIQTSDKKSPKITKSAKRMDNYQKITAAICEKLESGMIPWKKSWSGSAALARNYNTNRPYSFINQMILSRPGRYATFKQWHELGAKIRKGAKASYIYFFTQQPKETEELDENGEKIVKSFPVLREYAVFHENDVEGIELKPDELPKNNRIGSAEKILKDYINGSGVGFYELAINRAYYSPTVDSIKVPEISQFSSSHEYYSTVFHECAHSTGHFSRLNREGVNNTSYHAFGDEVYSREELIAEMASAFVCNAAGVDTEKTLKNSAAYIQSWLRALKNDKKMIVYAASRAEKAADYILSMFKKDHNEPFDDSTEKPEGNQPQSENAAPETAAENSTEVSKPAENYSYFAIDEDAARRAKELNSFSDYKTGSLTAIYKKQVDHVAAIAEEQKKRVDPIHHDKINRLVELYARKLADNYNEASRIDASYPSVLVAGPAGFDARKKEKQNARRDANMQQYNDIQQIINKIKGVGTAGIASDEENALEKLEKKIEALIDKQETMKKINAYYRKHKTLEGCPEISAESAKKIIAEMERWGLTDHVFPSWELSNNNANIRRLKARAQQLRQEKTREPSDDVEGCGYILTENTEIMRLQFIFDEKPDDQTRSLLKKNGFRWSPKNNAWQRLLNNNARYAAKAIIESLEK